MTRNTVQLYTARICTCIFGACAVCVTMLYDTPNDLIIQFVDDDIYARYMYNEAKQIRLTISREDLHIHNILGNKGIDRFYLE